MPKITLENGKQINISQESYDVLSKGVQGRWKPVEEEAYWFLDSDGCVFINTWENHDRDNFLYRTDNCFQTREEAEKHREYIEAVATIKEDAEYWEPDWSDGWQDKWCGSYDFEDREFRLAIDSVMKRNDIYFKSEEAIEKSLKEHRKEWEIYLGVEH